MWIYPLIDRLEKKGSPGENEVRFVSDGYANVEITLKSLSPKTLEKLRAAGLEIKDSNKDRVKGRIAIDDLVKLADLDTITLIMPRTN